MLRFLSPLKVNLPKWQNAPYRLQAWPNNDQADVQLSLYSRKAGFHYGWDWGPRLVTSGIWRKIYLTAWNDARIDDMQIFQRDVKSSAAQISAQLDITADTALKARVELVAKEDPAVKLVRDVALTAGTNRVNLDFTVHNPRLWWTNGLGGQPLYTFTATLGTGRTRTLDRRSVRTGLRSLRIVREADTFGKSIEGSKRALRVARHILKPYFAS